MSRFPPRLQRRQLFRLVSGQGPPLDFLLRLHQSLLLVPASAAAELPYLGEIGLPCFHKRVAVVQIVRRHSREVWSERVCWRGVFPGPTLTSQPRVTRMTQTLGTANPPIGPTSCRSHLASLVSFLELDCERPVLRRALLKGNTNPNSLQRRAQSPQLVGKLFCGFDASNRANDTD